MGSKHNKSGPGRVALRFGDMVKRHFDPVVQSQFTQSIQAAHQTQKYEKRRHYEEIVINM